MALPEGANARLETRLLAQFRPVRGGRSETKNREDPQEHSRLRHKDNSKD